MENCKVSVILPSLNVGNYMEECLKSVCEQSLKDIEIICVDAQSTDGTTQIIETYARNDQRIKLITSMKKSYGYQVNIGIREAKGKYIAILETDDYVDLDMYESLYHIAETKEYDYVKANYHAFFTTLQGKRVFCDSNILVHHENLYDREIYVPNYQKELIKCDTSIWSGIYRRQYLIDHHILCHETSGAAFQDIGFLQQVIWTADKAFYTKKGFYNYCTDREDSSTNKGNGLRYMYQEYQWLLTNEAFQEVGWNRNACLYERMVDEFVYNFNKILCKDKENENLDIIQWFLSILLQKKKEGVINRDYLDNEILDVGEWISQQKKEVKKSTQEKTELLDKIRQFPVVIFGAGIRGKSAYRRLIQERICVESFCDNNKDLWGTQIGDLQILSLDEAMMKYPTARYLVANKLFSYDIEKQLMKSGIKSGCIHIWNN